MELIDMGCLVLVHRATCDAAALREEAALRRKLCLLHLLNVNYIDESTTHRAFKTLKQSSEQWPLRF